MSYCSPQHFERHGVIPAAAVFRGAQVPTSKLRATYSAAPLQQRRGRVKADAATNLLQSIVIDTVQTFLSSLETLPLCFLESSHRITMVPTPPGSLGQRLLPSVIDQVAKASPSRILYSVPKTKDIVDGFQDIDAQAFAQAVNRCAWHLEKTIGRGQPGFPTLLYMGPQDIVYAILVCTVSQSFQIRSWVP